MNTRLIISLLCAGALAFACGPRSHTSVASTVAGALPLRTAEAKAPAVRAHKKTDAKAEAKINGRLNVSVASGDIKLALDVRNTGSKYAELTFPSGQSYEFVVVDSVGREVWRWSAHRKFTQGVQNKQLGAGEGMQVSEVWKDAATPGRYTAIATLRSTNYPVEQRLDFVMH